MKDSLKKFLQRYPRLLSQLSTIKRKFFSSALKIPETSLKKKLEQLPYLKCISAESHTSKKLFLDISILIRIDNNTGIQRVVRNTLFEFLAKPPSEYNIQPVYGCDDGFYRYACSDKKIHVTSGDIFLGLDLIPSLISRHKKVFQQFKKHGAKLYFIVYDLLPINYPHFFQDDTRFFFSVWLKQIVEQADGAICISQTVANELALWLKKNQTHINTDFQIVWFHLGANIESKAPNNDTNITSFNSAIKKINGPSILMVSTIEPRKGYTLALEAFEELWKSGKKINLIIIGKTGWNVTKLVKKIKDHPEKNKQLFWFENVNDNCLVEFYHHAQGLLMASECEGFGLSLIEAARYKLPILTRDIPVFREVSGEYASYFSNDSSASQLAKIIQKWQTDITNHQTPESKNMPWLSWEESTSQLLKKIKQVSKTPKNLEP